jgi:hypothetical protein
MNATAQQLRDKIKEEFKKCALDSSYFLTRYSYIQHPIRGRVLFDLYHYQKDALKDFENHDYNIVLKGRQIGISTLVAGYALWLMLFHKDKNILVIATKQETAKNLVTKVKFMHQNLPVWLRGNIITDNKLSLQFSNGSQIKAVASSPDAGRSEALSLLILDEAAFIDNADIIWTAASSTLSTGGKAILLSTPNGVGNFFHKMWQQAETKTNNFNTILLDWRVHPERDQAWRDRQTELMGELQAIQEHDASFIFSGNTVIPAEILEFYKATYVQEPISKEGFDSNLWVWEYPSPSKSYIVCADVARGDGEDYSTFHVIDVETSTQVAEYKGKVETKQFGNMLVSIATQYNDALLIPDNSSIGWNAIQQIIDRNYRNLFYMSRDLQYVDVEHQLNRKYLKEDKNTSLVPGFMISQRTRPLIIARLKEYMLDNSFTIRSSRMIAELETFIWKNGRPEALGGYNDDLVLALCIGLWVRDTALRLRQEGIELTKIALDGAKYQTNAMVYTNNNLNHNPYEMQIGPEKENLRWLL